VEEVPRFEVNSSFLDDEIPSHSVEGGAERGGHARAERVELVSGAQQNWHERRDIRSVWRVFDGHPICVASLPPTTGKATHCERISHYAATNHTA
jgi:hypothetical protein